MERKKIQKRERGIYIYHLEEREDAPVLIRDNECDASANGENLSLFFFPRARYDDNNAGTPRIKIQKWQRL